MFNRSDIMKAAWAEARQLLWSERGFHRRLTARSYIGRGMRHAWACARATLVRRQSAHAAYLALGLTVAKLKAAILCLECKDRLFPSDFQELDRLNSALRLADEFEAPALAA